MAKTRIIFRGLMAFTFEEDVPSPATFPAAEPNLGKMTVLLINRPGAMPHPAHDHEAKLRFIGDDKLGGGNGVGTIKQAGIHQRRAEIDWDNPTTPDGVVVARSVVQHVPRLQDLVGAGYQLDADYLDLGSPAKLKNLVVSQIVIPRGRLSATEMVWCEHADPYFPQLVRFAGLGLADFHMASECVLETEEPGNALLNLDYTTFTNQSKGPLARVRRFIPPGVHAQAVPPDTIEILITNFPSQRPVMAPFSTHYQQFFQLQGNPATGIHDFTKAELDAVRDALPAASHAVFDQDLAHAGIPLDGGPGHPFPFIPHPHANQALTPLASPDFRPICPIVLA